MENILGLDPGRDKCGLAIQNISGQVIYHQVLNSTETIAQIKQLSDNYNIDLIVMGDGTTSGSWRKDIESNVELPVVTVNEKNSTVEARDRYWLMYPPKGLQRIIPQGLRVPPRPVDDIVAILLIERYLNF